MKITAMAPNFVVEAPPGEEAEDARRAAEEMSHLRLVDAPTSDHPTDEAMSEETRAGLKRLAELIRMKGQKKDKEGSARKKAEAKELSKATLEQKREHAISSYLKVACYTDPRDIRGVALDKYY